MVVRLYLGNKCHDSTYMDVGEMKGRYVLGTLVCVLLYFSIELGIIVEAYNEDHLIEEDSDLLNKEYEKLVVDSQGGGDFLNIQDAIDFAKDGDLIFVKSGTYSQIVHIYKQIYLQGESKDNTFLSPTSNSNGYAIRITSDKVTISGFSIRNYGKGLYASGIRIHNDYVTINNCIIYNTPVGIAVWGSYNTITNCEFYGCEDEGIVFLGSNVNSCNYNTVSKSKFYDNTDGIELQYSSYNKIQDCEFYDNSHAGIDAIASSNNNNEIINCYIYNNDGYGVYFCKSNDNKITNCRITNNNVMTTKSTNNIISESTLSSVYLMDESYIKIENCKEFDKASIKAINSNYEIENQNNEINNKLRERIRNRIQEILINLKSFSTYVKNVVLKNNN